MTEISIKFCNDCKCISTFAINEDQDIKIINGKIAKECIKCGRLEE